jgi:FkbM family methyltransferase
MKTFLEIGACDFDNLDPLLDAGWRGIFVEPVPLYAESLRQKVSKYPNAIVEQVAITSRDGVITMDTMNDISLSGVNKWKRGISHISQVAGTSKYNYTSGSITLNASTSLGSKKLMVDCMKLDNLIDKHNVQSIDLLQLDVEGHEIVVLTSYSWKIKPTMMKIEHKYVNDNDLVALLESKGYHCFYEANDIYAILK